MLRLRISAPKFYAVFLVAKLYLYVQSGVALDLKAELLDRLQKVI